MVLLVPLYIHILNFNVTAPHTHDNFTSINLSSRDSFHNEIHVEIDMEGGSLLFGLYSLHSK